MTPRRLELDYVAPPRRSHLMGIALLGLALAAAGHLALRQQAVHRDLTALMVMQGSRNADLRPARSLSKERLDEEVKQAESVVRQLTLPWTDIVQAVEAASMHEVGVLNMQPDAQKRLLRLTAEAKSRETMLEYIRRMAQAKVFSDVYLVSHQVQTDDPSRPIRFAVQASFQGAP